VIGPTLHLGTLATYDGTLATYDAMALFLMALAAWCGRFLADTAEVPEYYLPQTRWQ
jgi:hypothetical protein